MHKTLAPRCLPVLGLLLGVLLNACGAAQSLGVSVNHVRDFEISNKSKEAVCSVELKNLKSITGDNTHSTELSIPPGQTKTTSIMISVGQDEEVRFKTCKGTVLKKQAFAYAKETAHVDIE